MATYIQGIQDRVEKVNPPQTDWQFEAQLLQTRQSKYDAGHSKLSQMYGKLLNSGLTRDQNIQAREEFFKTIDQDLRKVAGMDLSLESNVSKSQNVFNQIYENEPLVKDMVWTKQYQSEVARANSFRDCVDPAKCGGEYWEDGVKAMNYKREEYKNMSNQESLGASSVRYVPYNNMMEQAIKYAKDANLSVTRDELSGRYIMRTKNGANLISPLTDMFNQLFENNPDLHDMYKVQSYNSRKDWTYMAVQSGKYATLDEASAGYVEERGKEIIEASRVVSNGVDMDVSAIEGRLKALQSDYESNRIPYGSREKAEFEGLQEMLGKAKTAQGYTDMIKNAQKNMHNQTNMNAIGNILDDAAAIGLFNKDLNIAAVTLAHQDMEVTMTEDKFSLADQAYAHDVSMENLKQKNRISLEERKAELKGSELDPNAGIYMMDYKQKQELANNFDLGTSLSKALKDNGITSEYGDKLPGASELDIRRMLASENIDSESKAAIKGQLDALVTKRNQLKRDVNEAGLKAYKNGNATSDLDFHWDQFDKETWNGFKLSVPQSEWEGLDIPKGAQALNEGGPLLWSYPVEGNNNLYYKNADGTWFGGSPKTDTEKYHPVTSRSTIDKLNSNAIVWNK